MTTGTIVGKGLYLEFIPVDQSDPMAVSSKVLQVLFTPEGFDEQGNYVQFSMCSRTIADYSPRKQWRVTKSGVNNKEALTSGVMNSANAQELAIKMIERFMKSVEKAVYPNADFSAPVWKLRAKPIAVEITSFDLEEINKFSAPNPAIRRIQKCRLALDFPEKFV